MLRSAYGLAVDGLGQVEDLQPARGDEVTTVRVSVGATSTPPSEHPVDDRRVVRRLRDGRLLELDRTEGRAVFHGPPLSPDLLAHPYLAPVATAFNRWYGREAFHAGVFVRGGRAWVVTGPRTAGKSTLLAALGADGTPVLSDDILVTDGTVAHPGPRCVDLRSAPAAGGLFPGLPHRRVRHDERWRVSLPPAPDPVPLGGWFFLAWEPDEVAVRRVPAAAMPGRLAASRAWRQLDSDPTTLLALATLPAWTLHRPRRFDALAATLDLLDATVTGAGEVAPLQRSRG